VIPLDLSVHVRDAAGTTHRWGPDEVPGNRLRNVSFSTKIGEGFSSAQGQLARRIDLDYPDLGLVNTVSFIGADGSVAWEGRVSALPRELTDSHTVGVMLTGWMAHAKDRKFSEIFVDRDQQAWGEIPINRRSQLLAVNLSPVPAQHHNDPINGNINSVSTLISGSWISPFRPISEAWYDAGPTARIGHVEYSWKRDSPNTGTVAPWTWQVWISPDDQHTGATGSGNLVTAGPSGARLSSGLTDARFATLQAFYDSAPAGADGAQYGINWFFLAVYGTHGLPLVEAEPNQPAGIYGSDALRYIVERYCPALDPSGIMDTALALPHLAFRDPVTPYDAFLEINKYTLWNIAVWENRRFHFEPYDLSDYDWQIRTYDPGTEFSPQGLSIDDVFNGIEVVYTDILKGTEHRLTPVTDVELRSTDPTNPWNVHGIDQWHEIRLSTPTTEKAALQLGRAALAERNTPKTPGTIKVSGYIRNREGVEVPAWKVRAGDTIAVTDFPNDQPRLIVETSWDDERKELSISVDRPFALLDSYIDRLSNAVTARNVG
jgi:hypothetical protein